MAICIVSCEDNLHSCSAVRCICTVCKKRVSCRAALKLMMHVGAVLAPSPTCIIVCAVDLRSKALSIECADAKNAARNQHTCANAEVAAPDLVITALVRLFHHFSSPTGQQCCSTAVYCSLLCAAPCRNCRF